VPTPITIQPAAAADRRLLNNLMSVSAQVHTHLDWQPPQAWLGVPPFHFAMIGNAPVGALAAAPDPPDSAWIRIAVAADTPHATPDAILDSLWDATHGTLRQLNVGLASAMLVHNWLEPHLQRWQFRLVNDVVVLNRPNPARRTSGVPALPPAPAVRLRPAHRADLPALTVIDTAAFAPPWQYSPVVVSQAFDSATYATVAEAHGRPVGYQVSTGGRTGGHLARLAVDPQWQGRGVGRALVADLICHFDRKDTPGVTVNTQRDNAASLVVYQSLGFVVTNEHYPVWSRAV
jgi:ribosomal protein S18 acetylase RimI-like enzyme